MSFDEEPYEIIHEWLTRDRFSVVGRDVVRHESVAGVKGLLRYVEDHVDRRCLYARIVRSNVPHGLLKSIDLKDGRGFLVTARDVPGENQVGYAIADQPVLAEKKIRFYGEPVALVVAENGYEADDLLEKVDVDVEPLPAVFDVFDALRNEVLVHDERGSNVAITAHVRKGDVSVGEAESDVVVEKTYRLSPQDHAYIETEAALAVPSVDGVTVVGQSQYPHLAQKTVARVLGLPYSKVAIIQAAIGGAFGGKDDMGPIVSAQAALAAWKFGKPVFLQYSREESLTSHCKRDPAVIRCRTGASRDGMLKFLDAEVIFDSGAYANRGPYTLWRACVHVSGPYRIPHVNVNGKLVYTNKVYQGSFRGFGNPQAQFAAERQMDELARKLGVDPVEFRLKNLLRPGDLSATSQAMPEDTGVAFLVERMKEKFGVVRRAAGNGYRYGYGFAVGWHGISTSRGVPDWGSATLTVLRDGSVVVSSGIVEFGQGTHTAVKQVVAEVLGIPYGWVKLEGGTSYAPDTGATHGSRGLTLGGSAALVAAGRIRRRIVKTAAEMLEANPNDIEITEGKVTVKGVPNKLLEWKDVVAACYSRGVDLTASGYFFLKKGKFDESSGQGHAYTVYSFSAVLVEVRVDVETGKVEVTRVWPGAACGKIINPAIALGQIHGSVVQSLGYTLTEQLAFEEGRLITASFMDYLLPSATETPVIHDPVYYEDICPHGPFGAKGLAELALIPIPAAVANAVKDAVGVDVDSIPIKPEEILKQLKR
ncbi:MAG: xanthine dehydrogenase family protein molybdopterin-binding subunit [Candidatus Caldarchaeum sp.]|nr:xanthine dehydrogenase family protein molybdopterin-binding subunit [Candidatus Caldarchaeum sp.]